MLFLKNRQFVFFPLFSSSKNTHYRILFSDTTHTLMNEDTMFILNIYSGLSHSLDRYSRRFPGTPGSGFTIPQSVSPVGCLGFSASYFSISSLFPRGSRAFSFLRNFRFVTFSPNFLRELPFSFFQARWISYFFMKLKKL